MSSSLLRQSGHHYYHDHRRHDRYEADRPDPLGPDPGGLFAALASILGGFAGSCPRDTTVVRMA